MADHDGSARGRPPEGALNAALDGFYMKPKYLYGDMASVRERMIDALTLYRNWMDAHEFDGSDWLPVATSIKLSKVD